MTGDPDGAGRTWLAALPDELTAQRRVMAGLLGFCEVTPQVASFVVGCSLGRGAGDALSDIDAAIGVGAGGDVRAVEQLLAGALPGIGELVDVLRYAGSRDDGIRRVFAQFADRTQLDLAVVPQEGIRLATRPDFLALYQTGGPAAVDGAGGDAGDAAADGPDAGGPIVGDAGGPAAGGPDAGGPIVGDAGAGEAAAAYVVTGEQVREWAFHGWIGLLDADKYLRRGSLWEAHERLHQVRHRIWALWAAARGALYPWHGLSQVLDHDPRDLPPGIEDTVAGLDADDLRRAARASAALLSTASEAAAAAIPADLPAALAGYVSAMLGA